MRPSRKPRSLVVAYRVVDDGWIVKGAPTLLARDIGVRATIDIDVYREAAREVAEAELCEAAGRDIGDWFRFEIGAPRPVETTCSLGLGRPLQPFAHCPAPLVIDITRSAAVSPLTVLGLPRCL